MFALTKAIPHDLLTKPSNAIHPSERPFTKQTVILNAGKHLSEAITAKIVGPIVIFNSKVAAAAGALPPLLAAKGAVIGSAIATPIEVGAVASSSIVSGLTGKLVAVPISLATGVAAKLVGVVETGKEVWDENAEVMKDGAIKLGHIILKPIAVIVGAQTALTGAGLGIAGSGIKGVGLGMEAVGAKMALTGSKAKGTGALMIGWAFEPLIKAKVIGHDVLNDLEVKAISALMHGFTSNDGIGSKDVGSKIHLPILEQLSHDVKSH